MTATERAIAVVGGGFSGALVVAQLVRQADDPLTIHWFDPSPDWGPGLAYGTCEPCHLLNVRTDRIGAWPDHLDDFLLWLGSEHGIAARADFPDYVPDAHGFAPRLLFGRYLSALVETSLTHAEERGHTVHRTRAEVIDVELLHPDSQELALTIRGESTRLKVAALVLANGNLPPRRFDFMPGMVRGRGQFVHDVWKPHRGSAFPHAVADLPDDSDIAVIGTGLTAVDAVLSLRNNGFKGRVTLLSRHGWLPHIHTQTQPYTAPWNQDAAIFPTTALGWLRLIRAETASAQAAGIPWQAVIDSLRPITQPAWRRLPIRQRRRILTRLATVWSIHRHRMAPEIAGQLDALRQRGTLRIFAARIYYVGSDEDGMTVAYRRRGTNRLESIRAVMVLNCTGPELDIAYSTHPLLNNLRDRGLITPGPLRVGIETTRHGTALGSAWQSIFPMSNLLVGELFESTAVPELRQQAQDIAHGVIDRVTRPLDAVTYVGADI